VICYYRHMNLTLESFTEAARAGGAIISKYFGSALHIEEKSQASDVRTQADTESEDMIIRIIERAYPNINIFSEEAGKTDRQSEYTAVIDPLDGTNNFSLGVPLCTVSIAVMHNDEIVLGVIHNPLLNLTYTATKGGGAFANDTRLHVNDESAMKRSTVSYECDYNNDLAYGEQIKHRLNELEVKREINLWSVANDFCLLAAGKIEGIITNGNDLYDFAAGKLIALEAGALVTNFDGKQTADTNRTFITSNGKIHDSLLSVVRK